MSTSTTTATPTTSAPTKPVQALLFDLIGTCTDWKPRVVRVLREAVRLRPLIGDGKLTGDEGVLGRFAVEWRSGFFRETKMRYEAGQSTEDIDVTHRRVLNYLLMKRGITPKDWDEGIRETLVGAWHTQDAWPDTLAALERLKEKFIIIVVANGTLRLQIDITKSANLRFDALLSSEVLGKSKPDPAAYKKALEHLKIEPSEAMMVAAHAYDLRAAAKVGLRTMYVQRTTEDPDEDMSQVRKDVDFFLDGTRGTEDCGLAEVAAILGA